MMLGHIRTVRRSRRALAAAAIVAAFLATVAPVQHTVAATYTAFTA